MTVSDKGDAGIATGGKLCDKSTIIHIIVMLQLGKVEKYRDREKNLKNIKALLSPPFLSAKQLKSKEKSNNY